MKYMALYWVVGRLSVFAKVNCRSCETMFLCLCICSAVYARVLFVTVCICLCTSKICTTRSSLASLHWRLMQLWACLKVDQFPHHDVHLLSVKHHCRFHIQIRLIFICVHRSVLRLYSFLMQCSRMYCRLHYVACLLFYPVSFVYPHRHPLNSLYDRPFRGYDALPYAGDSGPVHSSEWQTWLFGGEVWGSDVFTSFACISIIFYQHKCHWYLQIFAQASDVLKSTDMHLILYCMYIYTYIYMHIYIYICMI